MEAIHPTHYLQSTLVTELTTLSVDKMGHDYLQEENDRAARTLPSPQLGTQSVHMTGTRVPWL